MSARAEAGGFARACHILLDCAPPGGDVASTTISYLHHRFIARTFWEKENAEPLSIRCSDVNHLRWFYF